MNRYFYVLLELIKEGCLEEISFIFLTFLPFQMVWGTDDTWKAQPDSYESKVLQATNDRHVSFNDVKASGCLDGAASKRRYPDPLFDHSVLRNSYHLKC